MRGRGRIGFRLLVLLVAIVFGGLLLAGCGFSQAANSNQADKSKATKSEKAQHAAKDKRQAKAAKEKAAKKKEKAEKARAKKKAKAEKAKAAKEKAKKAKAEKAKKKKEAARARTHKSQPKHRAKPQQASTQNSACPSYPAPSSTTMYLTVPKLGIYDDTVTNTYSEAVMNQGAIKLPSSGFPWQPCSNTYITGHRLGYAGTQSYYQFYNLPSMQPGDEIILKDANGRVYTYQVTRVFAVTPQDVGVTYPVPGKNMVSLQTCITSLNDWWSIGPSMYASSPTLDRLIVQGVRVSVSPS